MTDTLSIGWSRAAADGRLKTYRRLLGLNLALLALIGLIALSCPGWLLRLVHLDGPGATDWARAIGGLLLVIAGLQVPALISPLRYLPATLIAIVGRAGVAAILLFLGGGFLWFAAFDGIFAVILALSYHRLAIAELMTRP